MKKYLKLENLIYLTIFSLPLYLVRFKVGFFPANVLEGMLFAAILWWFIEFYEKDKLKKIYHSHKKYFLGSFLLVAGIFLSAIFHEQVLSSLNIFLNWFFLPIFFILVAADVLPRNKIRQAFWCYGLSSLAVAIISLGYLALGKMTYDGRLESFYNSPNYLAMYLAPGAIIFFIALVSQLQKEKNRNRGKKVFSLVGFLMIILVIYKTYSYGAWLALAASFLLMAVIRKRTSLKKSLLFMGIILILIFMQLRTVKFESLVTQNPRSSWASRQMIWRASFKMIEDNPILGIGPANFQATYLEYQKFFPFYLEWAVPHPQNLYLDLWLSGGILGLAGFLMLIFFFFRDAWKNKNRDWVTVLAFGIMAYFLVHGIFDSTYFKNDLAIIFWLNFLALKA